MYSEKKVRKTDKEKNRKAGRFLVEREGEGDRPEGPDEGPRNETASNPGRRCRCARKKKRF